MAKKKVSKYNLSDQVYDRIKKEILSGEWQDGQILPSENELGNIYGVSRLTIRIALQKLNALGLVKTRAGEGSFVTKFDVNKYLKELSSIIVTSGTVHDVLEFRKLLEAQSIKLAIKNSSDEEFSDLENLCIKYFNMLSRITAQSDSEEVEKIVEADYNIHFRICELSKNPLFALAFMAAQDPIKQYLRIVLVSRINIYNELLKIPHEEDKHLLLCRSLKTRNFEECHSILLDMIDYSYLPQESQKTLVKPK